MGRAIQLASLILLAAGVGLYVHYRRSGTGRVTRPAPVEIAPTLPAQADLPPEVAAAFDALKRGTTREGLG